jgi:hypothetical protein
MIIKFQEKDKWVVFGEIDHVEYEEIKGCGDAPEAVSSKVMVYDPPSLPAIGKCWTVSFFSKNMTEATIIQAYSPIYLMNDQGRTVETI